MVAERERESVCGIVLNCIVACNMLLYLSTVAFSSDCVRGDYSRSGFLFNVMHDCTLGLIFCSGRQTSVMLWFGFWPFLGSSLANSCMCVCVCVCVCFFVFV